MAGPGVSCGHLEQGPDVAKTEAGAVPGCAEGCGATTRSAGGPSPWRGSPVAVPGSHSVPRGPLQISPAAALDRICHPVPAVLDFPRSGVTVVPWLWLQGGTGCGWCQAVHSSSLSIALGSPTSAALPVARTVMPFWPPPVC